jgi:hypothetical protein
VNKRNIFVFVLVLFAVAFGLRTAVAVKQGLFHPMESDSHYYLQLAQSLSQSAGYCVKDSFWPDQPTMQRMPGWPFLVSVGLRVCPFLSPDVVMRLICIILDSLNAVLVGWLTWRLFWRRGWALLAGLIYAAHPAALFLVYNGESEPLFVTLCLIGFILLLRGGGWIYLASLCFGLSCLVRANYVIWIAAVGALLFMRWVFNNIFNMDKQDTQDKEFEASSPESSCISMLTPSLLPPQNGSQEVPATGRWIRGAYCLLFVVLFLAPSLFWAGRNYQVCGHFPVLSTLRGQTFYGGNNPIVANTMDVWGYWIFPDGIPGEKKASELAKTMSEYELDVYYYGRGKDYVKAEWFSMPRLLLGKFVRAYIPIPWKPNIMSYGVGVYRGLIYFLAIIGFFWWWHHLKSGSRNDNVAPLCERIANAPITDRCYIIVFLAMILTNLAGVLIFWGCFRFAFVLEPLLIPFAAATVGSAYNRIHKPLPDTQVDAAVPAA